MQYPRQTYIGVQGLPDHADLRQRPGTEPDQGGLNGDAAVPAYGRYQAQCGQIAVEVLSAAV